MPLRKKSRPLREHWSSFTTVNTPLDRKIVSFPAARGTICDSSCESCGAPKQTDSLCRVCAYRLVDIALSSSVEGLSESPVLTTNKEDLAPAKTSQLRYEHYEICQTEAGDPWELGRGAMGITYKATDLHLGCPVALKIINTRRFGGAHARDRFLHEARTAARLRHTNIASVFHLGLGEENCFYAMEYIEGETLEARIRREGVLTCQTALSIVAQSARALQVAHAKHFIHRDIKPTNIMLMADEHHSDQDVLLKLIDFGLVKSATESSEMHAICEGYFAGTPRYASPEQLESGHVDARSDIYSLGMCLAYMLTGKPPSGPASSDSDPVSPLTTFAERDLGAAIPANVIDFLKSMTAADPNARPQTAIEVLKRTEACLATLSRNHHSDDKITAKSSLWIGSAGKRLPQTAVCVLFLLGVAVGIAKFTRMTSKPSDIPKAGFNSEQEARLLYASGDDCFSKHTKADNQRAIDLYSKAIALMPGFANAHAGLAYAYFQNVCRFSAPAEQLNLAIDSAERAIAIDPNAPRGFAALGAIRSIQGRHWEALSELHHALTVDARYPTAMRDFSLLWSSVGQPQHGLPWAIGATQVDPLNSAGWLAAANACVDLCDDEQAEKFYRRCLEINPGWMPAHCGLIHLHLLQSNFTQARQDYQMAESIEPGLLLPLTLKAQIELFSGDYAMAETTYRRLLAMDRNGRISYFSSISHLSALGFLDYCRSNIAEGEKQLNEAVKLHPNNAEGPQGIYDLAAIRAVQNRREDALSLLQQSIASGWMDYRATLLDPRFQNLRDEPQFQKMIEKLKAHVVVMQRESVTLCSKPLNLADYPVSVPSR